MLFIQNTLQTVLFFIVLLSSITVYAEEDNKQSSLIAPNDVINNIENIPTINEIMPDLPEYKYYDIEVILFRQNNNSGLYSEYWAEAEEIQRIDYTTPIVNPQFIADDLSIDVMQQKNTGFQAIEGFAAVDDTQIDNNDSMTTNSTTSLANYFIKEKQFVTLNNIVSPLDSEQYVLTKEKEHLKYSKKYQLLAHFGWRQPGFSQKQALPIGLIFDPQYEQTYGEIKIVLSRYLHTKVNINSHEQVCRRVTGEDALQEKTAKVKIEVELGQQQKQQQTTEPEQQQNSINKEETSDRSLCKEENIQFKQSRKMRSKELHYLDHPVFGLLVKINPVKNISEMQTEQVKP
jgi:hypothetical protein